MNVAVETAGGVILSVNTALLVSLVFRAGRLVEKVEQMDARITRIEKRVFQARSKQDGD